MSGTDHTLSTPEMARQLLTTHRHGLRVAYEHYIATAPWVSFELFELGIEILSEPDAASPSSQEKP
jgi:hypothetical protein